MIINGKKSIHWHTYIINEIYQSSIYGVFSLQVQLVEGVFSLICMSTHLSFSCLSIHGTKLVNMTTHYRIEQYSPNASTVHIGTICWYWALRSFEHLSLNVYCINYTFASNSQIINCAFWLSSFHFQVPCTPSDEMVVAVICVYSLSTFID